MKMKRTGVASAAGVLVAGSLMALNVALAADPQPVNSFTGSLALTTNYIFRGVSQTNNGPAIQGGINYKYTPYNLYAGIWGSNVDSSVSGYNGASAEVDLTAGWAPTWNKLGLDVGYQYYWYPMTDSGANDTNEYHLGLSYDFTYVVPSFTAYYSNDWYGVGPSWYYSLNLAVPLPYDFTLAGHYGWNRPNNSINNGGYEAYDDYSVGLSRDFYGFGFSLAWVDRNKTEYCGPPFQCGSTAVFTVSKSF
jgi:uncharacterized protein (TIGR02001 family)